MQHINLTPEQRNFAEENHNLIFSFLRQYNFSVDEWYDVAALGYCKAVSKYQPERHLKFSTFAYLVMLRDVLCEKRKTNKHIALVSLQTEIAEGFIIGDTLCYEQDLLDDVSVQVIHKFSEELGEREALIFRGMIDGKRQHEMAGELGLSQSYISRLIKELRRQFKIQYGA